MRGSLNQLKRRVEKLEGLVKPFVTITAGMDPAEEKQKPSTPQKPTAEDKNVLTALVARIMSNCNNCRGMLSVGSLLPQQEDVPQHTDEFASLINRVSHALDKLDEQHTDCLGLGEQTSWNTFAMELNSALTAKKKATTSKKAKEPAATNASSEPSTKPAAPSDASTREKKPQALPLQSPQAANSTDSTVTPSAVATAAVVPSAQSNEQPPICNEPIAGVDDIDDEDGTKRTAIFQRAIQLSTPGNPILGTPAEATAFAGIIKNILGGETKLVSINFDKEKNQHKFTFENTVAAASANKEPTKSTIIALRQQNDDGTIAWRTNLGWKENCALIAAMQRQTYQDSQVKAAMTAAKQDSTAIRLESLELTDDEKTKRAYPIPASRVASANLTPEEQIIVDNLSAKEAIMISMFLNPTKGGFKAVHYTLDGQETVFTEAMFASLHKKTAPNPAIVSSVVAATPAPVRRSESSDSLTADEDTNGAAQPENVNRATQPKN